MNKPRKNSVGCRARESKDTMKNSTNQNRVSPAVVILSVALVAAIAVWSWAQTAGYTYTKIATLGVPPNFGDFEAGGINNSGDGVFVSETSKCLDSIFGPSTLCEGVFVNRAGQVSQIVAPGRRLPGGGTFSGFVDGPTALNNSGEAALALIQAPLQLPLGKNAGVFRYSGGSLSAVVVPELTKVPGVSGRIRFQGAVQGTGINNAGIIVFGGVIPSDAGLPGTTLGAGVFTADASGNLAKVMIPGDPAPNGTFDFAANAAINDLGDVVFEAHLKGYDCPGGTPDPSFSIGCEATGVYLRKTGSGDITKIAQEGDLDPLGTPFRHAWGPLINNAGQVLFVGDITRGSRADSASGLYLYNGSAVVPVVRPGDPMPGGGKVQNATTVIVHSYGLNNNGDVSFTATLNGGDTGMYVGSGGTVRLVARTGTLLPGIGTFRSAPGGANGPLINDSGQLLFAATLNSGETVLVLATPTP